MQTINIPLLSDVNNCHRVFDDMTDEIFIPLREQFHRCKDFKNVYRYMIYKTYLCDHNTKISVD